MALEILEPVEQVTVNTLLYGPPKTGKTAGASSTGLPTLYLNADHRNALHFARQRGAEISEVRINGMSTLVDVTLAVEAGTFGRDDVIVVDPLSELYRVLLEEDSNRAIRPTLNQRGDVVVNLERWCRKMCDLEVNVVFVCHELIVPGEDDVLARVLPFTGTKNPSLGLKLAGMVDVLGYTGRVETKDGARFMAQLVEGGGRLGGDRFACLAEPNGAAEMNLQEWFAKIRSHEARPETPVEENNETAADAPQEEAS